LRLRPGRDAQSECDEQRCESSDQDFHGVGV
jgi:hypothetical protein